MDIGVYKVCNVNNDMFVVSSLDRFFYTILHLSTSKIFKNVSRETFFS